MSDHAPAPAPMALDDVRLAGSGQSAAPEPADLNALEAATGAPSPAPLDLIGGFEEPPPSPKQEEGTSGASAAAASDDAPQPSPAQGTPPDAAAAESTPPAPMDLDRLREIEHR